MPGLLIDLFKQDKQSSKSKLVSSIPLESPSYELGRRRKQK